MLDVRSVVGGAHNLLMPVVHFYLIWLLLSGGVLTPNWCSHDDVSCSFVPDCRSSRMNNWVQQSVLQDGCCYIFSLKWSLSSIKYWMPPCWGVIWSKMPI